MDEQNKSHPTMEPRRRSDLDEVLALAEKLKRECEDHIARRERLKLMQFMAMGLMGAILLLSMTIANLQMNSKSSSSYMYIFLFTPLVFLPVFAGFFLYFNRVLRRNWRWFLTDSRALKEVVRLLRESEVAMVGTRRWSALDRARFRIQLTRFDIGDEFEEDYLLADKDAEAARHAYLMAKEQSERIARHAAVSDS